MLTHGLAWPPGDTTLERQVRTSTGRGGEVQWSNGPRVFPEVGRQPVESLRDGWNCAGGRSPLYRKRVDDTERERKADHNDERPEQREGCDCRGGGAGHQAVPNAVAEDVETMTTVAEGCNPGSIDRRVPALPARAALEDQRQPE